MSHTDEIQKHFVVYRITTGKFRSTLRGLDIDAPEVDLHAPNIAVFTGAPEDMLHSEICLSIQEAVSMADHTVPCSTSWMKPDRTEVTAAAWALLCRTRMRDRIIEKHKHG